MGSAARWRTVGPVWLTASVLLTGLLGGCAADGDEPTPRPEVGQCRLLTPEKVAQPSNNSPVVDCTERHTAQTFAVGDLPSEFDETAYDDRALSVFAYQTCSTQFAEHLGADESLVMRTVLTWAWFRPSREAWDAGERWYRCDIVGGGPQSTAYVDLPASTEGLLTRPEDEWLVCANGATVSGSVKVPCSEPHTWRAVTTIKLGGPDDPYPGDKVMESRTRSFCSESVGGWLGYPVNYDFGYTWFHRPEWEAGNRRSVCWAKTDQ